MQLFTSQHVMSGIKSGLHHTLSGHEWRLVTSQDTTWESHFETLIHYHAYQDVSFPDSLGGKKTLVCLIIPERVMSIEITTPQNVVIITFSHVKMFFLHNLLQPGEHPGVSAGIVDVYDCQLSVTPLKLYGHQIVIA